VTVLPSPICPFALSPQMIAVGRYYLDERTKRAGIAGFTAEVLRENRRMQAVFNHSGLKVTSRLEEGVFSFEMASG